jgi:hypothetical protein
MTDNVDDVVVHLPIKIKQGKYGRVTKNGKKMGRPRKPENEVKKRDLKRLQPIERSQTRRHKIEDDELVKRSVLGLAKMGRTMDDIANFLGVSKNWLRKHHMQEIKFGREIANALVVENLYAQAMKDAPSSIQAGIYLTKARMGWRDKDEDKSAAPSVVFDFSDMDPDERLALMRRISVTQGKKQEEPEEQVIETTYEEEGEDDE